MTNEPAEIDVLQLMAYADGRISEERAARLAAVLETRPDLAALVRDIPRQNAELHAYFDRYAREPLPGRLTAVLERSPTTSRDTMARPMWRSATAAASLLLTGSFGWWMGQRADPGVDGTHGFVQQTIAYYATGPERSDELASDQPLQGDDPALARFSSWISLELKAPDLSAHGFDLVGQRQVAFDGQRGVAIRYAGPKGVEVQVFIKSRWREAAQDVRVVRRSGLSLTHWHDGPLAVAVASNTRVPGQLKALAKEVQTALGPTPETRADRKPATVPVASSRGRPADIPASDRAHAGVPDGPNAGSDKP